MLQRIGRIIQPTISEPSSDRLDDRHCVNTEHATAAPADLVTGSIWSDRGIHIIKPEDLWGWRSSLLQALCERRGYATETRG